MGLAYRRVALSGRAVERHSAEYRISFELRVATLGHVQRGVTSSFFDWLLATMHCEELGTGSLATSRATRMRGGEGELPDHLRERIRQHREYSRGHSRGSRQARGGPRDACEFDCGSGAEEGLDILAVGVPTQRHHLPAAVKDLLEGTPRGRLADVRALAFDTRYPRSRWIIGSAAREIGKLLRRMGCKKLAEPESFFAKGAGGPGGRTVPGRGPQGRWGEPSGQCRPDRSRGGP